MLRRILQIFLTIQLLKHCAGKCYESRKTFSNYLPPHYDVYRRYVDAETTVVLTNLTVHCEGIVLPVTWIKETVTIDYDCGGCTQVLTISRSNISIVPPAAFKGFSTITILRISDLHLEKIKPGAFNSLHSLKELYLFGNKLRVIGTGIFNSLTNLEVLDLSKNNIQNITADSLTGVTNLKKLNLSSNRLAYFESAILDQNIVLLEHVDLSFNILSNIDVPSVSTKIGDMDLFSNNIKELNFCPFEFRSFNISKNNITLSKKPHCSSFSIVHFDASYNNISDLDSRIFSNLRSLEYLNLQYNNISSIPTGLFSDLSNLIALNLSHNHLQQLQFGTFEYLENLTILDISHNKITTLNRFLHPLLNLNALYIQSNNIAFLNGIKLLEDLPKLASISFKNNDFSCNELIDVMHYFRRRKIYVEYGTDKNKTNIHGIYCSDNRNFRISPTDTSDVNFEFEDIILSKLQQLANGDLKKSVVNDYFNNEFKNSNFYKYLENFHGMNLPKFNETTIFNYFNEDFENSKFYKYLEGLKDNENFTIEFSKRMFQYFDNDFKNSNFVKYLNGLKTTDDDVNNNFFNSAMYKYFNKDFKSSYFYKYLENLRNSNDIISRRSDDARKVSDYIDEQKSNGLFITMVILLVVMVLLMIISLYMDFTRQTRGKRRENVELLEA